MPYHPILSFWPWLIVPVPCMAHFMRCQNDSFTFYENQRAKSSKEASKRFWDGMDLADPWPDIIPTFFETTREEESGESSLEFLGSLCVDVFCMQYFHSMVRHGNIVHTKKRIRKWKELWLKLDMRFMNIEWSWVGYISLRFKLA